MSGNEFTYSRIDMDRPSFRLIRLLRGGDSYISCKLFEAYLDESQKDGIPYEALSYTWGNMDRTATILVNGMKARVTKNLFIALRHLRLMDSDRILWIDAVCIDQGHEKERGHQVRQMGDIYQKADRVIVWLGTATEDTDSLMQFLTTLPPAQELVPEAVRTHQRELLRQLLSREWFRRVWIIQEVAKAKRAIVVCGWKSISTRVFTKAPSILGLKPDLHIEAVLDVMPGHLRVSSWFEQQPTLHTLLQKFQGSEASDKRDMIYALLGMSSSVHEQSRLQANYELDLQVLIRKTTSTLLFPALPVPPALDYIKWSWPEFVQHLPELRTAAFMCALRKEHLSEQFIQDSGNGTKWNDFDVGYKDEHDRTALHVAVELGHDRVVTLLLEQDGIDINARDDSNRTALHVAAERGHESVVILLLKQGGIDINARDKRDRTALNAAVELGHGGIVILLLEQDGIDINALDDSDRIALYVAAERGNERAIRLLLRKDGIGAS